MLSALVGWVAAAALAANGPLVLRAQVYQPGNFIIVGNTLGWDCKAGVPAPLVVGTRVELRVSATVCIASERSALHAGRVRALPPSDQDTSGLTPILSVAPPSV